MKTVSPKKNVLIAVSGMSTAVITESIWALATQKNPIIPDKVVVLTTRTGKCKILQSMAFKNGLPSEKGPWGVLKKTLSAKGLTTKGLLKFTEETIKVFTGEDEVPLDDLRTRTENLCAANLMMKEIREYTEDDDWIVHTQLAGGRKTMSALLFSCMCLLGRPCDHIYHILVSEGYDNPRLDPPFFFPQRGIIHRGMDYGGRMLKLPSSKVKIELFDVPFVPMGEWAAQKCKGSRKGLTYQNVIASVNAEVEADIYPRIEIDLSGCGRITLNGSFVKLSHFEFALFVFIVQGKSPRECLPLLRELKNYLCCGDGEDELLFEDYRWVEKFMGDETKNAGGGKFARYSCKDNLVRENKLSHDLSYTLSELRKALPRTASMDRLTVLDSSPTDFDSSLVIWKGFSGLSPEILTRILLPETRKRLGILNK